MTDTKTHTLDVPGAVLTYDVREAQRPADHRPLFVFGSPMGASGFTQLVPHFADRTVITYDPRVSERSSEMPRRGGQGLARMLGTEPVVFPGDHGGFVVNEWAPDNDPEAFAQTLRSVLDDATG